MPRVAGDIPGPAPLFDPYVRDAGPALQRVMYDGLIDTVAAIHAVAWEDTALESLGPGHGLRDAVDALGGLRGLVVGGRPVARAGRGARLVRPPPARRARRGRCCGATCAWATSSSTPSAG